MLKLTGEYNLFRIVCKLQWWLMDECIDRWMDWWTDVICFKNYMINWSKVGCINGQIGK